ncbi:MAG: Holliday junction branch migration protein RuvA [bacterium]|nr:Holliday junction branch migration protein RuvA [bacterium]
MIARLAGTLLEREPDLVVVDAGGVGYAVHVSLQTLAALPPVGQAVHLLIHTEVREDAIELFGFGTARERTLFHLLRRVKGIGPRLALAVLSGMPADELARTVAAGDRARLEAIPGIGRRTAERIVVECREAAAALAVSSGSPRLPLDAPGGETEEAVSVLVNLGYARSEAERAVRQVGRTQGTLEDVVRAALQGLGG